MLYSDFQISKGVNASNPCVVQESSVIPFILLKLLFLWLFRTNCFTCMLNLRQNTLGILNDYRKEKN